MGELSHDDTGRYIVEDARVQDSDAHAVHSHVRSEEDVPAVIHDSEPALAHRVARVLQVALEEIDLSRVHDWVVLA